MPVSHLQHTLQSAVTLQGVGVHSGAPAKLTLKPAPANHGIVFTRTDISDRDNKIPALWNLVADTRLCTVLKNAAGASVATVEHVMSALAALGVDNCAIDIDGPEIPIMDGSSAPFAAAIDRAGRVAQNAARRVIRVLKPVTLTDGDKTVTLSPANETSYTFDINFANALIGRQSFTHGGGEDAFRADIGFARTFGFLHEVEALRAAGLGLGGSLDNAVVVDGDKVLNPDGLRSPTEFVRHKILDAIGDIALAGMQVIARYHGDRAGHAMNNRILHALFDQPDAYTVAELAPAAKPARRQQPAGRRVIEQLGEGLRTLVPA